MFTKKFNTAVMLIICYTLLLSTAYGSKSVFIISSHDTCLAEAFRIDANGVSFQAMIDISTYNPGIGPVGIADTQDYMRIVSAIKQIVPEYIGDKVNKN